MTVPPSPGSYRTPIVSLPMLSASTNSGLSVIRSAAPAARELRRRPTLEQGRGLEILGHAIEYLIDSRMHRVDEPHPPADSEAAQILMRLNREIFRECSEVVSPMQRLRLWYRKRLRLELD